MGRGQVEQARTLPPLADWCATTNEPANEPARAARTIAMLDSRSRIDTSTPFTDGAAPTVGLPAGQRLDDRWTTQPGRPAGACRPGRSADGGGGAVGPYRPPGSTTASAMSRRHGS